MIELKDNDTQKVDTEEGDTVELHKILRCYLNKNYANYILVSFIA